MDPQTTPTLTSNPLSGGMPGGAPGVSPTAMPVATSAPAPEELSQAQMRSNLQNLMGKIDSKYKDFSTQQFSSAANLKEQQSEVLRQIFDLLKSMGVDPSNVEQVKAFLDKIKQTNPALFQQIDSAMIHILGSEMAGPQTDILAPDSSDASLTPPPAAPATSPGAENMNMQNATPPQTI